MEAAASFLQCDADWPTDVTGWPLASSPCTLWDHAVAESAAAGSDLALACLLFEGAADADGAAAAAAAAAPFAAEAPAAQGAHAQSALAFRCLDASHAEPCARCSPSPVPDDCALYILRRDKGAPKRGGDGRGSCSRSRKQALIARTHAGAKNGEKRLRGLLCKTREWCDGETREATAVRAEANGMPELAAALRARDISALRKRCVFVTLRRIATHAAAPCTLVLLHC